MGQPPPLPCISVINLFKPKFADPIDSICILDTKLNNSNMRLDFLFLVLVVLLLRSDGAQIKPKF